MSIHRIGHVAFTVSDLERASRFAEEVIGLRQVRRDDDVAYFTSNGRHHQLRLRAGATHACEEIAFDVERPEDLAQLRAAVMGAGIEVVDAAGPHVPRGIRFSVPDGPTIALCHGVASTAAPAYSTLGARPRKLGHVTIASPDTAGVARVLTDVLGFRISDRLPLGDHADGELSWYRCNADHHGLGLTPGKAGVHHYAWELDGFSSYGVMGDHLLTRGIRYIWGPGRHGPGENTFAYFPDSEGSMIELYDDMLQIEDDAGYELAQWPDVESSANVWGPPPPPEWFAFATPFVPAVVPVA